jgi:hypothetical protein
MHRGEGYTLKTGKMKLIAKMGTSPGRSDVCLWGFLDTDFGH